MTLEIVHGKSYIKIILSAPTRVLQLCLTAHFIYLPPSNVKSEDHTLYLLLNSMTVAQATGRKRSA